MMDPHKDEPLWLKGSVAVRGSEQQPPPHTQDTFLHNLQLLEHSVKPPAVLRQQSVWPPY